MVLNHQPVNSCSYKVLCSLGHGVSRWWKSQVPFPEILFGHNADPRWWFFHRTARKVHAIFKHSVHLWPISIGVRQLPSTKPFRCCCFVMFCLQTAAMITIPEVSHFNLRPNRSCHPLRGGADSVMCRLVEKGRDFVTVLVRGIQWLQGNHRHQTCVPQVPFTRWSTWPHRYIIMQTILYIQLCMQLYNAYRTCAKNNMVLCTLGRLRSATDTPQKAGSTHRKDRVFFCFHRCADFFEVRFWF